MFSVSVINTMPKSNLKKKAFISSYTSRNSSSLREAREGTQGRNLEKGNDEEAIEECSIWLTQLAFLQYPGLSVKRWHLLEWTGPPHINHQSKKCTTSYPTGQCDGGIFSIKFPQGRKAKTETGPDASLMKTVFQLRVPLPRNVKLKTKANYSTYC